jgi:hypothetical protein
MRAVTGAAPRESRAADASLDTANKAPAMPAMLLPSLPNMPSSHLISSM